MFFIQTVNNGLCHISTCQYKHTPKYDLVMMRVCGGVLCMGRGGNWVAVNLWRWHQSFQLSSRNSGTRGCSTRTGFRGRTRPPRRRCRRGRSGRCTPWRRGRHCRPCMRLLACCVSSRRTSCPPWSWRWPRARADHTPPAARKAAWPAHNVKTAPSRR